MEKQFETRSIKNSYELSKAPQLIWKNKEGGALLSFEVKVLLPNIDAAVNDAGALVED